MVSMQIVWLAVIIVSIILEAITISLLGIWFCAGGLAAMVVSLFAPDAVVAQVAVFTLVSGLSILLLRPVLQKYVNAKRIPTNADAAIGKRCQVVGEIQPGRFGRVRLEGQEWTAKSETVIPVGAWCRVEAIEGVKLVVTPLPENQPANKEGE